MTSARAAPILRQFVGLIILVVAFASVASASARDGMPVHEVIQTRSGTLKAILSYVRTPQTQSFTYRGKTTSYTFYTDSEFRLSLLRSGQLLFNRLLNCPRCEPATRPARDSLHFDRLQRGARPALLLDLYTGGAHCCYETVLLLTSGSRVHTLDAFWGDPNYRLVDLDHNGYPDFVTADDRFAYQFTAYASSLLPIKILRLEGSSLVDVTRSYPGQIERDARSNWSLYLKTRTSQDPDVRGILAAWAADEALLGHWPEVSAALNVVLARGDLDHGPVLAGWPRGQAYVTALRAYLTKLGYL